MEGGEPKPTTQAAGEAPHTLTLHQQTPRCTSALKTALPCTLPAAPPSFPEPRRPPAAAILVGRLSAQAQSCRPLGTPGNVVPKQVRASRGKSQAPATSPAGSHARRVPARWLPSGCARRQSPSPPLSASAAGEAGSAARPRRQLPASLPPARPPRGVWPVPESRQRPQEARRRRWAPQAMPLPRCSGGGQSARRRRRRGRRRGAAAAAEGPRAGGGGGGREGHQWR